MFKQGEIVRLSNGTAPIRVVACDYVNLWGIYVKSGVTILRSIQEFTYFEERLMTNPFKVGDEVKLKTGNNKMFVHRVNGKFIRASYRKNTSYGEGNLRVHTDFDYFTPRVEDQLFETKEGPATLIGKTRRGLYVLEKINDDEELIYQRQPPVRWAHYTVELENIVDKYTFHRATEEGKVEKGDLIKRPNGKLYRVIRLNTRSHITQQLEGEILTGKPI